MLNNFFAQPPRNSNFTFSDVPNVQAPRSSFDLSKGVKTAFNSGDLVPIYLEEIIPGDTFNLNLSAVARLATPIVPFMDNLQCDFFYFWVPNRLIWTNFQKFMGEQLNPSDSISYVIPTMVSKASGYDIGGIHDYFGLPTLGQVTAAATVTHSALPLRAYNLIYRDWFRDENLQNSPTINSGDGPDLYTDYSLKKRGKRHDYFTSCLPWPQKGTAVSMPLGTSANVRFQSVTGQTAQWQASGVPGGGTYAPATTAAAGGNPINPYAAGGGNNGMAFVNAPYAGTFIAYDPMKDTTKSSLLYADLTNATSATINQLREAFQVQGLYERFARGGTRYIEIVKAHFGVDSEDLRATRPTLLGIGSSFINLHPVPQTSSTSGSNAQAQLAAFGTMNAHGIGFTKSFTEHGYVIGLASVRASNYTYQQGLHKMWSRSTRTDFYWPALAHLGEQAVLNKEIYVTGNSGQDDSVFGYNERWSEMRFGSSIVTGKMRSTAASTIDIWHLAQKFTALPTLGDTFISEAPPVSRVIAVTSEPEIILDAYHKVKAARPLPVYSVPGLIDRF